MGGTLRDPHKEFNGHLRAYQRVTKARHSGQEGLHGANDHDRNHFLASAVVASTITSESDDSYQQKRRKVVHPDERGYRQQARLNCIRVPMPPIRSHSSLRSDDGSRFSGQVPVSNTTAGSSSTMGDSDYLSLRSGLSFHQAPVIDRQDTHWLATPGRSFYRETVSLVPRH